MKRRLPLRLESLTDRVCPALFGNPWLDPNLTLSFVPDGTLVNGQPSQFDAALSNLSANSRTQEVLRAFQSWIAVANVNVGIVPDGGQAIGVAGSAFNDSRFGDIRVSALPLNSADIALAFPFDVAAGTRSGDVLLNSTQSFRIGSSYDLFSITLHEAGHVFGVEGSTDPTSAMYQFADRVRTGPNADDVTAIQALYGPRRNDSLEGNSGNATIATAARLQPQHDRIAITADLTTASDVDVYSFKADKLKGSAFLAQVHVKGLSLVVPRMEILDKDGTVLATGVGSQPGSGDVSLRLTNLKEGDTYYARITSTDTTFAVGAYRLELRPENLEDDDDLDDPEVGEDDSPSTADSLERLQASTGTRENFFAASSFSSSTDVDFHRVRSSKPTDSAAGALTIALTATGTPAIDAIVEVFDEFQNLLPATILSHDGGEYVVQVANTLGNRDYFIRVRHDSGDPVATGNYSLGIDFGGPVATTKTYLAGELTSTSPASTQTLTVPTSQVLHLILNVSSATSSTAARMTIYDSANKVVDTRLANAGTTSSMNVFLPAGTYQLLAGGGATSGTFGSAISFAVIGGTITDPIGPKAVPADQVTPPTPIVPPPPPPIIVTPPQPVTPTVPVAPTDPNILLIPPTDQPTSPALQLRPVTPPPAKTLSVGTANFSGSMVQSFQANGSPRFQLAPFSGYTGAIRTAEADVNADGIADILVGTGPGSASQVQLYDGGSQSLLFTLSPFEASFTGGVFVTLGDTTGDGRADLIVTPDEGGGPRVRIFNGNGFGIVMDYFGIEDPNFRGGARATVGDLNADGTGDVIVAAGFAGGPRVAAYDGAALSKGTITHLFGDFFAFEQTLRNGVYITAGDVDGDGFAELIAGGGPGGGPRVLALSGKDLLTNQYVTKANFFAGDPNDRNGVRLAVKNLDTDGRADLVVNVGQQVRGYLGTNLFPTGTPPSVLDLTFAGAEQNGIFVG